LNLEHSYETSLLVFITAEIAELRRDKVKSFFSAFSANSAVDSSSFFYDQTGRRPEAGDRKDRRMN
jgi:hypothetical protein